MSVYELTDEQHDEMKQESKRWAAEQVLNDAIRKLKDERHPNFVEWDFRDCSFVEYFDSLEELAMFCDKILNDNLFREKPLYSVHTYKNCIIFRCKQAI